MKKDEAIRKIKKKNHVEDNLLIAKYGRFAGRVMRALTEFEMAVLASEHPAIVEAQRSNVLLSGLEPFLAALKCRDARFFEDLAQVMRRERFPVSPVWESFLTYVWAEQKKIRFGERAERITRKEVAQYLAEKFNDKVPDTKISKMATQCGIKLVPGKPGPTPRKRKR
ncbi:MAG: hypothetical protein DMF06_05670 [Verrucomicrobia bacterium]|nr:MAG: hypothetical protein DMF06_05670 [Verrucomicrobiota bacterium]